MTEAMPLILFLVLFLLLLLGYPVAFTLGGVSVLLGLMTFGADFFNLLPLRIWGVMTNYVLLAVPLFVYMGVMLEKSGLAEDMLETMALLFGRLRGGLAVAVVIVGALLGASTGIVGATVVTMGLLSLPTMLRRGYSPQVATGTIAASGTLGQIIPPSVVLVLLGSILKRVGGRHVHRRRHPGRPPRGPVSRMDLHRGPVQARRGPGHARRGAGRVPGERHVQEDHPGLPASAGPDDGRAGLHLRGRHFADGSGGRGRAGRHPAHRVPGQVFPTGH